MMTQIKKIGLEFFWPFSPKICGSKQKKIQHDFGQIGDFPAESLECNKILSIRKRCCKGDHTLVCTLSTHPKSAFQTLISWVPWCMLPENFTNTVSQFLIFFTDLNLKIGQKFTIFYFGLYPQSNWGISIKFSKWCILVCTYIFWF